MELRRRKGLHSTSSLGLVLMGLVYHRHATGVKWAAAGSTPFNSRWARALQHIKTFSSGGNGEQRFYNDRTAWQDAIHLA